MKTAGKFPGPILAFSYILILPQFINVALCGSFFQPADNYLINCGSPEPTTLDDGRTFISDPQSASYLSTDEDILVSENSLPNIPLTGRLYLSARIFRHESMYRFFINKPGRHFIRLHFHPLPNPSVNMTSSTFSVSTDETVLLHGFSFKDRRLNNSKTSTTIVKEYLVNVTSEKLTLKFSPSRKSAAFVNAIELVSAPDDLIPDSASSVNSPRGEFTGLDALALEVLHRVNVGGPLVTPKNDTLWRTWLPDEENGYAFLPQEEKDVIVPTDMIRYSRGGATALVAPPLVYSTAAVMADSDTADPNFNLTWSMRVDPGFNYLIRLHFCDIVSTGLNELYFNVYLNGLSGASALDLSTLTSGLAVPHYMDFVLNALVISNGTVTIQVGPTSNVKAVQPDAILNGFEVMKLSNSAGSLDGLFSSSFSKFGRNYNMSRVALTAIGLALGSTTLISICIGFARRRTRRNNNNKGCEKQKSRMFSSWLLPLTATQCSSFLSSKSKIKSTTFSSIIDPSSLNLGRHFTLNEIRRATRNFDEKSVVGVGGFGKVYLGELEDGTRLAVKRGNPSSSQGVNEFQTEIQLLSKLRHRHLVSLIGYCDEQSEMILVYEYVAHGPLRDHLYGGGRPVLSWRRRLEICIGAARGLHYLHTGSAQGSIIHRDVKTTNILLDENFVAKVSDFGLSRAGPGSLDQTHVSTAVKGSFGYLDPEYFRRQQLTEKSDVYSFGVVLFEVLCARPALDPGLPREQVNLAEWARRKNARGEIGKIVDPVIAGTICGESLSKFVEAAEKCLAEYGVDRPSMGDVLWHLECALQLQGAAEEDSTRDDDVGPTKGKVGGLVATVDMSDDSGVVVSSSMFLENFQGR
ncbi:kinase family protein [Striga asiatica]|uniref:Kinase family protein n=1 Tax=Striga asiatica TaxID=4170 RepID=A0A5A7R6R0_STRAF|nr:kinase family protein [Striga asiatica]